MGRRGRGGADEELGQGGRDDRLELRGASWPTQGGGSQIAGREGSVSRAHMVWRSWRSSLAGEVSMVGMGRVSTRPRKGCAQPLERVVDTRGMSGPTDRTPSPQVAVPSTDSAPKPADHGAPETVQTQWNLDYDALFPGPSDKDQALHARTPDSALYLDLKVAPNGEPGKEAPPPMPFNGTDLSRSGAAHLGGFAHPKGRGGKVSGSIGAGKRPTFSFTLKSKALHGVAATKAHSEIAAQWSRKLDDFATEQQAEAILRGIIDQLYPDGDVTVQVSRTDHAGSTINPTSLNYGSVSSDRTFNLKLAVPTAAKDHVVVSSSSKSGETTNGTENNRQQVIGTEVGTSSTNEIALTSQVKSTLDTGLNALARTIIDTGFTSDLTTTTVHGDNTKVAGGFSLKSMIDGALAFSPGKLLEGIPGIGPALSKLGSAELKVHMEPNFNSDFGFNWNNSTDTVSKLGAQAKTQTAHELASYVKSQTERLMSTTLKTSIAAATKVSTTNTTGDKTTGGDKATGASSVTETKGSVEIVKAALQPSIVEE